MLLAIGWQRVDLASEQQTTIHIYTYSYICTYIQSWALDLLLFWFFSPPQHDLLMQLYEPLVLAAPMACTQHSCSVLPLDMSGSDSNSLLPQTARMNPCIPSLTDQGKLPESRAGMRLQAHGVYT